MPIRILATLITLLAVTAAGRGADWPQFRGPGGTGVVTGSVVPPDTWTGTQNVAWKYEVPGHGWSCPIVVGGKVFVTSSVTDSKLAAPKTGFYAPTDTKTHDGEHRWTLFCLDAATGKVLVGTGRAQGQAAAPDPREGELRLGNAGVRRRAGLRLLRQRRPLLLRHRPASNCGPARGTWCRRN